MASKWRCKPNTGCLGGRLLETEENTEKQNHNFIVFCSSFPETVRAEYFCCCCCFVFAFFHFFYFSRAFASSFRHFCISSLNYHFVLIYRVSVIYCNFVVIFEKQIQPIKLENIANNKTTKKTARKQRQPQSKPNDDEETISFNFHFMIA